MAVAMMEQVTAQQELNKSLLRLTYILQQSAFPFIRDHGQSELTDLILDLQDHNTRSAIDLLMGQPALMESLRKAHTGTYSIILSLLGCLDHSVTAKKLVDRVIDDCDHVINLREEVLIHRIRYALTSMDDKSRGLHLARAAKSLEK